MFPFRRVAFPPFRNGIHVDISGHCDICGGDAYGVTTAARAPISICALCLTEMYARQELALKHCQEHLQEQAKRNKAKERESS